MTHLPNGQLSWTDFAIANLGGPRTSAALARLDAAVPWEAIVKPILQLPEYAKCIANPSQPGQRPIDPRIMIRALMLQKWFNLSDPQLEEQLQDRISFRRFVGLAQKDRTPDETTFVKFRGRLREAKLDQRIFDTILKHIASSGLLVKNGTIVDATIIEQSRGHGTGKKDDKGEPITTRDPEASFTKKNDETYHGYKLHAATDISGIITGVITSTASHHDSRYIDELTKDEKRAVLADSAYSDRDRRNRLADRGVIAGIIHKRVRGQKELFGWQKRFNKQVSKVRALGEHPFAWMKRTMHFARCRYRGLHRNAFDFVMTVTAYNVKRMVSLQVAKG
jgi:transposase, IS5 family